LLVLVFMGIILPIQVTPAFDVESGAEQDNMLPALRAESGRGANDTFAFATATDLVFSPQPTEWEPLPDMAVSLPTGGPVVVHFCGSGNTLGGNTSLRVRPEMDGSVLPSNATNLQFIAVGTVREPRCFMWVFPSVQPGPHTFRMMWRTAAGEAVLQDRSLIVMGRRYPVPLGG
jgi:hypothetical protein